MIENHKTSFIKLSNIRLLTSLRPRSTERPSTSSKERSRRLAETIIKSKMFQPQAKNSLLKAINFSVHSSVNMEVNTCKEKGNISFYK